MTMNDVARASWTYFTYLSIVAVMASPALAQQAPAAGTGRVTVAGGVDIVSGYMFRGIRQDDAGPITWPHAQVGVRLHQGDRGVRRVVANIGSWNSFNRGWTGRSGPSNKSWYEADGYAAVELGFGTPTTGRP